LKKNIPYTEIAEIYDYILRHVDYQQWYEYISGIMINYIDNPRTVLELGCGTGKFGAKFSTDDFKIIGLDMSLQMLRVAKTRAYRNFRIACADIRNFAFKNKFDFIFSVHDTMNYMLIKEDIASVFRCTREVMHSESIFLFDITTENNIKRFFDNKTSFYKTRGIHAEWSNKYDKKKKLVISSFKITAPDGSVSREEHFQRIYSIREVTEILAIEGFEILDIFSDYTTESPNDQTVMINFVTRKRGDF